MISDTGDNFMQWFVVNTFFQEKMDHHNQEDGSRETQKLDPCWKSRPVACMVTWSPDKNLVSEWRQHSILGRSVFTEQSRKCVKNMNPFTKDQGDLIRWWDNQLCSVWSRQKFLWIVMTQRIKIFCWNNMENELRRYHNKINRVNAGFLNVVEIGQHFRTKETADLSQFHADTLPREDGSSQPVAIHLGYNMFFLGYQELLLGYQELIKTFLGYTTLFLGYKQFFGYKQLFLDTKFFRDTKCFFRETKVFGWPKSQNITKITNILKWIMKKHKKKKNKRKQNIFLFLNIFFWAFFHLFDFVVHFWFGREEERFFPFFFDFGIFSILLRTILDPWKCWPLGLLFGTFCCSCLVLWAIDLPARDHPCPRPLCVGSPVVVVLCGVSVRCVFKIFVGASKIWALPLTPPAGPPSPDSPSAGPPNISLFSLSRPHFRSFCLSLGVHSRNLMVFGASGELKSARLESPNEYIWGSRPSKTPPKFNEKTLREREREKGKERNGAGEGKTESNILGVRRRR